MTLTGAIRSRPLVFLFGLAAVSLIALAFVPPIPQPQSYHQFADQHTLFGIPHFWNVVSNLPFILVGALGLWRVRGDPSAAAPPSEARARRGYFKRVRAGRSLRSPARTVFFLGVFLTGFSSSYYHWNPNDLGLFWDRLPMSVAFMAILASAIEERVDARAGRLLLWPLVALGIVSLLIWLRTDDLRLYGWVQFFPCAVLPLLFWLFPPKYTGTWYWFAAAGWYVLAKLLEHFDKAIYAAGHAMSGHPLKHVAAACACYAILRAFETRRPIG